MWECGKWRIDKIKQQHLYFNWEDKVYLLSCFLSVAATFGYDDDVIGFLSGMFTI